MYVEKGEWKRSKKVKEEKARRKIEGRVKREKRENLEWVKGGMVWRQKGEEETRK